MSKARFVSKRANEVSLCAFSLCTFSYLVSIVCFKRNKYTMRKKTKQDNMPDRRTRWNSEVLTQGINRIARGDGTTDRSQWMLFIENSSRGSKFEIPFYYYIVLAPVCLNAVHYLTISPYDRNCVRQYRSTHEKRHDSFYCCFVICNLMNTHAINFI